MTDTPSTPLVLRAALALTAAAPALPRWLAGRAHRRQGAAPARLAERWGQASVPRPEGRLLWVHAASVGEVAAVRDLATELAARARAALLLTTTTAGGAGAVPAGAIHQFAPIDTAAAVGRFLDHWRPSLGVFVEGDLWPRLVLEASGRGVPLALVNARPSRTRARLPRSMGALIGRFAVVTTQGMDVRDGLLALGLDPDRVHPVGDLRADAAPLPADPRALEALRAAVGSRPVWAAVSTHPADETPVIAAHLAVRQELGGGALLIWTPRHPPRAEAVRAASRTAGLTVARRGLGEAPGPDADVYLVDTLGETGIVFRAAPLVLLGGSFGAEGGHNPLEPARLGAAVLSGPNVANHAEAYARLWAAGAARRVADAAALGSAVVGLLGRPELDAMRAAATTAAAPTGAQERTLALLLPLLAGQDAAA